MDILKEVSTAITDLLAPFIMCHSNYFATICGNINKISAAHYPELCLAWLRSQDPEYTSHVYPFDWSGSYRIIKINCPVNVIAYDKDGNIVAKIEKEKVKSIKDSSIVSMIDEDGTKIIYLPTNKKYSVEIIATDKGTVNISVNEYSGIENTFVKNVIYKEVEVQKKDTLYMNVPQCIEKNNETNGFETKYSIKNKNGNDIAISNEYTGKDIYNHMYYVEVLSEDIKKGNVIGSGVRNAGDFAMLNAYGNEGYHFVGWYNGNNLVSKEREYRFKVISDVTYTARFEEGNEPLELSDVMYFAATYWFLIIPAVIILFVILIILFKRRK